MYIGCGHCGGQIEIPGDLTPQEILSCIGCTAAYEAMTETQYTLSKGEIKPKALVLGPIDVNNEPYRLVELLDEVGYGE